MRPRLQHADLPLNIYFKHGAYYRVVNKVWERIGKTLDGVDRSTLEYRKGSQMQREHILNYSFRVLARARANSKLRQKRAFELTKDDVRRMLDEARWRCSVSGLPFSLEVVANRKPFAPSIDRMDCAQGYISTNCRMVCLAVNYAMNVWGDAVFKRMIRGIREEVTKSIRQY